MFFRSFCLVCCLSIFSASPLFAAEKLYLQDFINLALKNNPQLEIGVQQYMQATGRVTQAQSGYLPHLQLNGSLGRMYIEDVSPTDEDNVVYGGISASQLIYDFGQTTGAIESSKLTKEAARSNIEQYLQDVILLVKESFYNVLETKYLIDVAREKKESYEKHLYRAKKFYQAGVRTQIDITNAELELANSRLELLRAKADLKSARVQLEQVIGTQPHNGTYIVATQNKQGLDNLTASAPVLSYDLPELLAMAPDHRPGLQQVDQLFYAAEASLKTVRGENWPLLAATGSYDTYETDLQSVTDQWQVAATLTWEIFSGFETEGKIAEAKARMLELGAARRELELSIIQDITNNHLRAVENYESIDIAGLATQLAKRNLELAEGRYQAGLGDMIEYNDAQLGFTSSRADLISIYFAYLTSLARIDRAAGIDPGIPEGTLDTMLE
ncbi:MAG: outer membrane protein [Desulforhopalus sp.]|jgi:outer membrane protein